MLEARLAEEDRGSSEAQQAHLMALIQQLTKSPIAINTTDANQQIVRNPDGTRVTTTWNFENQPTQYNQPANTTYPVVTMAYNADNQRVQKQA